MSTELETSYGGVVLRGAELLVIALAILVPVGLIALAIALLSRVFVRRARERALEMA